MTIHVLLQCPHFSSRAKGDYLAPVNAFFLRTCRLLGICHVGAINTCAHLNAVKSNTGRI